MLLSQVGAERVCVCVVVNVQHECCIGMCVVHCVEHPFPMCELESIYLGFVLAAYFWSPALKELFNGNVFLLY